MKIILIAVVLAAVSANAFGQGTAFNYQGRLNVTGSAANGNFDFEFRLFSGAGGAGQLGPTLSRNAVSVTDGVFTVNLDFGNQFDGAARFLEISVRQAGAGSFTTLTPRQPVTSAPYSIKTLAAATADAATNASSLGGVAASQYLQTNGNGSGLTNLNASSITTGTLANGRLGQIPTANIADSAVTAAKIATGQLVKSLNGLHDNVTLAAGANISITPSGNTLTIASTGGGGGGVGGSGTTNNIPLWTAGTTIGNSVITQSAGRVGIGTTSPTAGLEVLGSAGNSAILGTGAGSNPASIGVTGTSSILGATGVEGRASFGVGVSARALNGGTIALRTEGTSWFKGDTTPLNAANTGTGTGLVVGSSGNLGYISAFDYSVFQPRTLLLNNSGGNVGIGTTTPIARLEVISDGTTATSITGTAPSGALGTGVRGSASNGIGVRGSSSTGTGILAQSFGSGGIALGTNGTSFFRGDTTPLSSANTGPGTGVVIGSSGNVGYISAFDYSAFQTRTLLLNNSGGNVGIGTNTPDQALSVVGNANKSVGGGSWGVFSDERLKNIKGRFSGGLKAVMKLQPLRYEYKTDNAIGLKSEGEHVGFSAQAVEKIIPEAVTKTEEGYRLVNNDPILWTMLNAIKEQQAIIVNQQRQIDQLKQLSCRRNKKAAICRARAK